MANDDARGYFQGRKPFLPHHLCLAEQHPITLLDWLRTLPEQRYVAKATLKQRTVLAKFFVGKKAEKALKTELAGYEMLKSQAIATPQLLLSASEGEFSWVLFEFLQPAQSLLDLWQAANETDKQRVLAKALSSISAMHQKGLWQDDLHLDNFLWFNHDLWVIDVASVKKEHLGSQLSLKKVMSNLAVFFAQLPRMSDEQLNGLLQHHVCQAQIRLTVLKQAIEKIRRWRLNDYLGKTARDCSLFSVEKNSSGISACVRQQKALLADSLQTLDQAIDAGHLYKTGGAATVVKAILHERPYIIKRYNIKNFKHWLTRFWRPSRAWHSWQAGHMLNLLNIPVALPLAVKEQRRCGLRFKAWLVTEYCGEESLMQRFQPYVDTGLVPENELNALKSLFNQLIAEKISHGDFKAHNIFWQQNQFVLIDLDAVKQHKTLKGFAKAFQKDRQRLLRNWPKDSALYQLLQRELPQVLSVG